MKLNALVETISRTNSVLDLKRQDLPQIPQAEVRKFVESLGNSNIAWISNQIPISKLLPSQTELNTDKISKYKERPVKDLSKDVWIVSKDYHMIDGHHRWAALKEIAPEEKVQVILVNASIAQLISLGHNFMGSYTKGIYQ